MTPNVPNLLLVALGYIGFIILCGYLQDAWLWMCDRKHARR